jgi:glutamate-1-semialdehyde 2,1-aminomutase
MNAIIEDIYLDGPVHKNTKQRDVVIKNNDLESIISQHEFAKAKSVIPGGLNSHAGSFKNLHREPFFVKKAKGSRITDVDKNEYIDYHLSGGIHILGHAPASVLDVVEKALWDGINYGMPTTSETFLAEAIVEAFPSIDKVRLVNSDIEAISSAIRLAQTYTGKNKIIAFEGHDLGKASHAESSQHIIYLPFNDQEAVFEAFAKHKDEIAAIIVEPVPSYRGVILPGETFLSFLRNIKEEFKALLLFDETITGFRPRISGAQGIFGVIPDITILGNILGGGFPLAAYGGHNDIMALLDRDDVWQSEVLPVNQVAMTAGIAMIKRLHAPLFHDILNQKSRDFIYWLEEITQRKGIVVNSFHSMFTLFFSERSVNNFADIQHTDAKRFERFYKKILEKGVFLSPSPFEANFISIAHAPEDLNKTLDVVYQVLKTV